MKGQKRSQTGELIPLDGSVTFCERFVVRGEGNFDVSPYVLRTL